MTDSKIGYALTGADTIAMTYQGFNMCEDPQDPTTVWVESLAEWRHSPPAVSPLVSGLEMRKNLISLYAQAQAALYQKVYESALADGREDTATAEAEAAQEAYDDAWADVANSVYLALSTGNILRARLLLKRAGENPLADQDTLAHMLDAIS